MDFCGVIT